MSLFKLPHKSWVVVCDGARALFMENIGDAESLNLRVAERSAQEDAPSRERDSCRQEGRWRLH